MATPFTIDPYLEVNAAGKGAAEARAEAVTQASVTSQNIANDMSRFNHAKAIDEERKVGIQNRNNRAIVAQSEGITAQRNLDFIQSDAAGVYHTKLLHQANNLQVQKNALGLLTTEAQIKVEEAQVAGDVAKARKGSLEATVLLDNTQKMNAASKGLNSAAAAAIVDKENGGLGSNTVDYIVGIAKSDPSLFGQMYGQFKPFLDRASENGALPPVLQDAIRDAKSQGSNSIARSAISANLTGITEAEAQGKASAISGNVVDAVYTIGLDAQDPQTLDSMQLEETDAGYVLVNSVNQKRSEFFSKEEFNADPYLRGVKRAIRQRSSTSFNSLSKSKAMQSTLAEIAKNPMSEQMGQIYTTVVKDLEHVAADKVGFMRTVNDVMAQMGEDAQAYNPMYREGGRELYDMADKGALGRVVGSGEKDLAERFTRNPHELTELLTAYNNRATGGMPESVYTEYVQQIAKNITRNNPKYDENLHSKRSIDDRKRALYGKIQNSLGTMQGADAANTVLRKLTDSDYFETPAGKQFAAQNIGLIRQYFASPDAYSKRDISAVRSTGLMKALKEYLIGGQMGRDLSVSVPDIKVTGG